MERRKRLNLWLLAGIALAGWLIWRDVTQPPPAPAIEHVTMLDPAAVTRIGIERSDGQRLLLERTAARWWLIYGDLRLAADSTRIGEILRLADAVAEASYDLAGIDPGDYGLQPPRAVVTIDGVALRIGAQEPLRYRRYVATGSRLHLIADTAYVHLGADWNDFVDPSPFAGLPEPSTLAGPGWRLVHTEKEGWRGDPAWPGAEEVAMAWLDLAADRIRSADTPATGVTTLRMDFPDDQVRELDSWREGALLWLAWRGASIRFGIPQERAADLGLE